MTNCTQYIFRFLCIVGILVFSITLQAQVTIGTDKHPAKAAILDLKTKESSITADKAVTDPSNVTSDKGGLILPRVKLTNIYTLAPFITTADDVEKKKHAGLMVYNINDTYLNASIPPDQVFKQGIYMWDGSRWSLLVREEFKFFHMPSFVLDVSQVGGPFTVDLYKKYINQFTRTELGSPSEMPTLIKNPGAVVPVVPNFKRTELDYYITYYDGSIIKNVSVSDKGVMTYHVDPTGSMDPYSYLSIVFVVK